MKITFQLVTTCLRSWTCCFASIFMVFNLLISIANATPLIVLDAGHEPKAPGAIGTCKQDEVVYNDEMVREIKKRLKASYQIILTRQPGSNVEITNSSLVNNIPPQDQKLWSTKTSLLARPAIANLNHAQIFISIHHDSTALSEQIDNPLLCDHQGGKDLNPSFKSKYNIGYNVFIDDADKSPRKNQSLLLAENIGQELKAIGRTPSNYHVYPHDGCKSCYPINNTLGVWHENLAVLRNTYMPAVLIEVGNIVDSADEKIINTAEFRRKFSVALKNALDRYFKPVHTL